MSTRIALMIGEHPGTRVIDAREANGWTQAYCAMLLHIAPQTLCDIELGRRGISIGMAKKFADIFPGYGSGYDWARLQFDYDWSNS